MCNAVSVATVTGVSPGLTPARQGAVRDGQCPYTDGAVVSASDGMAMVRFLMVGGEVRRAPRTAGFCTDACVRYRAQRTYHDVGEVA